MTCVLTAKPAHRNTDEQAVKQFLCTESKDMEVPAVDRVLAALICDRCHVAFGTYIGHT